MQTVELKTAYHWHCEDCGHENFALPQKAELTDDEREDAYRTFNGLDEFAELPNGWADFAMVYIPDFVKCEECSSEFETIDERPA